jgi:hypothetical protein
MASDVGDQKSTPASRERAAPSYHLARRLALEPPTPRRRLIKIGLLILVTWVPLVLVSLIEAHPARIRLLRDPVTYSRFLFVIPLLELAQIVIPTSLAVQAQQFLDSGLVPEKQRTRFDAARAGMVSLRHSVAAEVIAAVLALAIPFVSRAAMKLGTQDSTWERMGTNITVAGWWYILVSMPVMVFLLLRWVWIFAGWAWFLVRVSRLDLELTPTHPDQAGGLGFLGWGLVSFAIVVLAVSAVLSASLAGEILFRGSSLDQVKYHVIVFVVLALLFLHAPLLAFSGRLGRCRFRGLLDFGTLIGFHDRAFDEKWVKSQGAQKTSLLGSPDVSSLAALAAAYEHVERMRLIPFDRKAVLVLIVSALIPMIPLVGTAIPLKEILAKLGEFLV